ncbi:hypothetical protein [Paractinoplanes atraurantiacus]|nr:hypothetical protein [Actinoplanes atraurantiacus]
MRRMKMTVLGLAGLLALAGCAAPAAAPDLADETYALTAAGLEEPQPAPTGEASKHKRAYLRKNTLHGEIVVQGKDGPKTLVVQRGTVTATDDGSLSVKSTDGFTQTWTKAEKFTVRGDLKTGVEVGVAGRKEGDKTLARLVVVKKK